MSKRLWRHEPQCKIHQSCAEAEIQMAEAEYGMVPVKSVGTLVVSGNAGDNGAASWVATTVNGKGLAHLPPGTYHIVKVDDE